MRALVIDIVVDIVVEVIRFIIVYGLLLLAGYFLEFDLGFKDAAGIYFCLLAAEMFLGVTNDR